MGSSGSRATKARTSLPDVRLRPMSEDEFRAYRAWAVPDYAAEVQRNSGIGDRAASAHAERVFRDLLPQGLATAGNRLLIAEDPATGERVGLLWIARQRREGVAAAWIYDVMVEEPLRGKGYGRSIMQLAEDQAREMGVARLELNVFGDNAVARRLYTSLGYVEMSRQMGKELPPA
jgi:GNAT superfamily N-acetyltransferase